jgi:hypothetical protein
MVPEDRTGPQWGKPFLPVFSLKKKSFKNLLQNWQANFNQT